MTESNQMINPTSPTQNIEPNAVSSVESPNKPVDKATTNQVVKATVDTPNPTGKGGFGDNPQNRSDGRWSKDNSFSYWMNHFKSLTITEFEEYQEKKPREQRTMAEQLAFTRVNNAQMNLKEFEVVANRTEGKPKQNIDHTTGGEKFNTGPLQVEFVDGSEEEDGEV
jgi:hypothetical protein